MKYTLSLQKIAYLLIIIALLLYFSIFAKSILVPFVFATLFAFLLKPICTFIERVIPSRILATIISFFSVLLPLVAVIYLFSMQFAEICTDLPTIGQRLEEGLNTAFDWVNKKMGSTDYSSRAWINENATKLMGAPVAFLGKGISSSTTFIANVLLFLLYTFLLLLYRSAIKEFVLIQVGEVKRAEMEEILKKIQQVVQQYLSGMGTVMLILGTLNSLGLYFIGIKYPMFWGFLAAILAIIPYIGTFIGGFLPFIFALATTDSLVQPGLVALLFLTVQTLEGNIITPKIVGSSVKINPLAAILFIVFGGFMWGISGLILSLPIAAILGIIIAQIDFLKPLSVLLSDNIYGNSEIFEDNFDKDRFRLWHFLKKKKQV